MSTVIISITAIIALLGGAGFALYKERSLSSWFLFAALTSTALLELFDLLSLSATAGELFWKKCAVTVEALLPPFWILCSLTFARQSDLRKFGAAFKAILASPSCFQSCPAYCP